MNPFSILYRIIHESSYHCNIRLAHIIRKVFVSLKYHTYSYNKKSYKEYYYTYPIGKSYDIDGLVKAIRDV